MTKTENGNVIVTSRRNYILKAIPHREDYEDIRIRYLKFAVNADIPKDEAIEIITKYYYNNISVYFRCNRYEGDEIKKIFVSNKTYSDDSQVDSDNGIRYVIDSADNIYKISKYERERRLRNESNEFLETDFAKEWLNKMEYTIREDNGNKYLFLAILVGYEKISNEEFQALCNAICYKEFGEELCMCMWIGGKVNWTMFYRRPDHVNGHETYFCGVVAKDGFSPEDWDKDHSEYIY